MEFFLSSGQKGGSGGGTLTIDFLYFLTLILSLI